MATGILRGITLYIYILYYIYIYTLYTLTLRNETWHEDQKVQFGKCTRVFQSTSKCFWARSPCCTDSCTDSPPKLLHLMLPGEMIQIRLTCFKWVETTNLLVLSRWSCNGLPTTMLRDWRRPGVLGNPKHLGDSKVFLGETLQKKSSEQWKQLWLFRLYKGLYSPLL